MHNMVNPSYLMPHFAQSSPSRLGQQPPLHRFNQGRATAVHYNEGHAMAQSSHSTYNADNPLSAVRNGAPWGKDSVFSSLSGFGPFLLLYLVAFYRVKTFSLLHMISYFKSNSLRVDWIIFDMFLTTIFLCCCRA